MENRELSTESIFLELMELGHRCIIHGEAFIIIIDPHAPCCHLLRKHGDVSSFNILNRRARKEYTLRCSL